MMRLQSDLSELCLMALDGKLADVEATWDPRSAMGVVLAAGGYPGSYDKGLPISGLTSELPETVKVFHAGTAEQDGKIVTNGGRVLCVTALGDTIAMAKDTSYRAIAGISWQDMTLRRDIGWRAIARYSD